MAEILADPDMRAETVRALPVMADAIRPCGAQAVRNALQPLVLVFGIGEAAKSAAFWAPYIDALDGMPERALAKGIAEYSALVDSQFFPKPGPLKALCEKHAQPMWQAVSRAKRIVLAQDEPPPPPMPTPEQRGAVAEDLRTLMADFASRPMPRGATMRRQKPLNADRIAPRRAATPEERAAHIRAAADAIEKVSKGSNAHGATAEGRHITPQLAALMGIEIEPGQPEIAA